MLSKSLIQFFVGGWSCVLSLLFTWAQTMVEVMKIMVTSQKIPCMYWYTQCLQPWSRPPQTHASPGDSWTHPGKSASVSCGVTAPFFWVLVHTRFCLYPSRVYFPVLYKFLQFYDSVNGYLLQEGLCHTQWQSTADLYLHRRHTNTVLSQSLWCLWSRSLVLMILNDSIIITEECIWFQFFFFFSYGIKVFNCIFVCRLKNIFEQIIDIYNPSRLIEKETLRYKTFLLYEALEISYCQSKQNKLKWDNWEGAHKVSLNILSQLYMR